MLTFDSVCVDVGGAEVLRGVSFHVPSNTFAALIGHNGAGKTTTMRALLNLIPIKSGQVTIGGARTTVSGPHEHARRGIGYMPEGRRLVPSWTVEENILLPAWATGLQGASEKLADVYDLIPEVREFARRSALQLSGGQQKLVALARALLIARTFLVLDEPFEGIAPVLVDRLLGILTRVKQEGGLSVLLSASDFEQGAGLSDLEFSITRGRIEPSKE